MFMVPCILVYNDHINTNEMQLLLKRLYSCSFNVCFLIYKNFISWLMRKRVAFCTVFWLCLLFPFTRMDIYLGLM